MVPVCNLTDAVTKQKESYNSHMNTNDEENAIQRFYKISGPSNYGINADHFINISNIFFL